MIYNYEELSFQILTIDSYVHKKGVFRDEKHPFLWAPIAFICIFVG